MTGSALVITRLSSVAMNIGREVATIATQSGLSTQPRVRGSTSVDSGAIGTAGAATGSVEVVIRISKKALNDYLVPTVSNRLITCQP